MKLRELKANLSTRIILIVVALLVFSSALFCAISIQKARTSIRQSIQQRMVDIANCAAGSVNGDVLKDLKAEDRDTPGYKAIYDTRAVFRNWNISMAYGTKGTDGSRSRWTWT